MSENIKQVYDANPSSTVNDADLLYIGQSPFGLNDDSAITYLDFFNQVRNKILGWNSVNVPGSISIGSNSGYLSNTLLSASYVITSSPGDYPQFSVFAISGGSAPGFTIQVPSGVTVVSGNTTYIGPSTITSNSQYDIMYFLCTTQDTNFTLYSSNDAAFISAGYPSPVNYTPTDNSIKGNLAGIDIAIGLAAEIDWVWVTLTAAGTHTLVDNTAYICNTTATTEFLLPSTATIGDKYKIIGGSAPGFIVKNNSGQFITSGTKSTGIGAGSSISSTDPTDSLQIDCVQTNTEFNMICLQGEFSIDSTLSVSDLPDLMSWYKADDVNNGGSQPSNNSALSSWKDIGPYAQDLSQATGSFQPIFKTNAFNGLPGLLFDGVDDYMSSTILVNNTNKFYMFFVTTPITWSLCHGWLSVYNPSFPDDWNSSTSIAISECTQGTFDISRPLENHTLTPPIIFNKPLVFSVNVDGSNSIAMATPFIENSVAGSGSSFLQTEIICGARWSSGSINSYGNEYFHEIIIGNGLLTIEQQKQIMVYLSNKWGVPL
jgi:hypothetical protein